MRVGQNLNLALGELLTAEPDLVLFGEDVIDPYGGAFKITQGLSTRFPGRVRSTPISEATMVGMAAGVALAGGKAIVELMFADFVGLAFDQIVNFASKSVTMYGRTMAMPMIVRCPSGGGRGYGPTHSQSPQKHFIGAPGLDIHEMSPFHDNHAALVGILRRARPTLFFEDKLLYPRPMFSDGRVDDLFSYDFVGDTARVFVEGVTTPDFVIITPGGMTHYALKALRNLAIEDDVIGSLLVPSRLYPYDIESVLPEVRKARTVCVAEESTAGGTWGADIAQLLHSRLWGELRRPVVLVNSADSVIPAAPHLESLVLARESTIHRAIAGALRD